MPEDIVGRRVMKSYSEQRGADLCVIMEPYYISVQVSTNHGSAFGYDTHVPLIFMGAGIKSGRFHGGVAINDVAPTWPMLPSLRLRKRTSALRWLLINVSSSSPGCLAVKSLVSMILLILRLGNWGRRAIPGAAAISWPPPRWRPCRAGT